MDTISLHGWKSAKCFLVRTKQLSTQVDISYIHTVISTQLRQKTLPLLDVHRKFIYATKEGFVLRKERFSATRGVLARDWEDDTVLPNPWSLRWGICLWRTTKKAICFLLMIASSYKKKQSSWTKTYWQHFVIYIFSPSTLLKTFHNIRKWMSTNNTYPTIKTAFEQMNIKDFFRDIRAHIAGIKYPSYKKIGKKKIFKTILSLFTKVFYVDKCVKIVVTRTFR